MEKQPQVERKRKHIETPQGIDDHVNAALNGTGTDPKVLPEEIFAKYEHLKITDSTDIPPAVPIVKINGEIICTEGNVTTISGASKSGKTACVNVIIAGAIAPGKYDGFPGLTVEPARGKAVLHIDTEQARHKHQKNIIGILNRVGLPHCPDNFLSYNIRQLSIDQYPVIVEALANAAAIKFDGIHSITIDGSADFIKDVNEADLSNMIVKFFEELAIKYSAPVIVIVHVNPGSDKERGHLGSQLQRKSESVLSVKVQDDISSLEPKFLRMAGKGNIPSIQFIYDTEKGYHVYYGVKAEQTQSEKDTRRIGEIQEITNVIFAPPVSMSYEPTIEKIMQHTNRGVTASKNIFTEMKAHKMIIQEGKNWKLNEESKSV